MSDHDTDDEPEDYGPYDEDHPPPLDFERWAALAASLIGVEPDDRIDHFAARGVKPALFDACELFWANVLMRQVQRGELGLAKRLAALSTAAVAARADGEASHADPSPPEADESSSPDETAFMMSIDDDPALPFQPDPSAPRVADVVEERPLPIGGATELLSAEAVAVTGPALPFATQAPMDPERYAEIVVRTEGMSPGVTAAIHAELGITDRVRLDADMRRFFADHPDARVRYEASADRRRRQSR